MPSTTAAGTGLAISAGVPATQSAGGYAALSYTEVSNVEQLGGFGATTEVTTFQPLKGAQQKHKGPTNFGALNPTIALDDADAGQALLAAAAAPDNRALYAVRVTKSDGSLRYFQVRVFGMPETIGAANSMITAAPVLEINTPVVKVAAGAPAAPVFTTQPSISPTSGAVGTTFTANDGAASNASSYTRRWLLGSTAIGTGTTVTPNAAGTLTLEVTATGTGGSTPATSSAVTVSAGTPTPSPAPAPIIGMTAANTAKLRAARAANRNVIIAAVGPSTTAGQTASAGSTQAVDSWPMQAAAMLQTANVNAGANNMFGDKACYGLTQNAANFMAGDGRVSLTGSAGPTSFSTVGGNGFAVGAAAAGTIVFTPQGAVTKFDIWWRDGSTGNTFSYAIDGGAATNVATSGTAGVQKTTVSAGTRGTHALTLSWVVGTPRIVGITAYDDTGARKELSVFNWGSSGARSAQLISDTDPNASPLKAWTAMAPDLTIIDDFAINDWRQSVTVDTFKANLLTAINKAKESGDVFVTTPLYDNGTTGATASQADYATATVDVATSAAVTIIDIRSAWKSYAEANAAGWYSDTVHPTKLGYTQKANAIAYAIQQALALS